MKCVCRCTRRFLTLARLPCGQIWQRLVKHFNSQAKAYQDYNVEGIAGWDLNKAHLTSRLIYPNVKFTKVKMRRELLVIRNVQVPGWPFLNQKPV